MSRMLQKAPFTPIALRFDELFVVTISADRNFIVDPALEGSLAKAPPV